MLKAPGNWSLAASRLISATAVVLLAIAGVRTFTSAEMRWRLHPVTSIPAAAGREGGLLVIYQALDCNSHARFIRTWEQLHKPGEFLVTGVPLDGQSNEPWRQRALEDLSPRFPVRKELGRDAAALLTGLGKIATPAVILLDGSGRPRVVLHPPADPRSLPRAREVVESYRSLMRESAP